MTRDGGVRWLPMPFCIHNSLFYFRSFRQQHNTSRQSSSSHRAASLKAASNTSLQSSFSSHVSDTSMLSTVLDESSIREQTEVNHLWGEPTVLCHQITIKYCLTVWTDTMHFMFTMRVPVQKGLCVFSALLKWHSIHCYVPQLCSAPRGSVWIKHI